jgi:hypothetical protein
MFEEIRNCSRTISILAICLIFVISSFITIVPAGREPGVTSAENDFDSAKSDVSDSFRKSRGITDSMVEYLIIAPEAFVDAYQPLADWKTRKGVPAKIVSTEFIEASNTTGAAKEVKIQQYLADFNTNNGYNLTWVLLGADDEFIPALWVYTEGSQTLDYADDYYPTDYYYSGLFSNWNTDGDSFWGEPGEVDYNPKAFVGRLPADNSVHVTDYVNQVLKYEQSPPMDGWLDKALLTDGLFDHPNIFDNYATPSVDEGYGYWEDNGLEATLNIWDRIDNEYTVTHLYDYDEISGGNYIPAEDILTQASFVDEVNKGYGVVNIVSHSFLSGNGTVSYEGDGSTTAKPWKRFFYYTDAAAMINGDKRSFMYFSDCDILNFTETDDSNFEQLFTNPYGGAIAVVGPTGSTYRGESDMFRALGNWWIADRFWYLFSQGYTRPGETMYRTKWDYYNHLIFNEGFPTDHPSLRVNMASYNLLGDPEVPVWYGEPSNMSVDVEKQYVSSDLLNITVTKTGTGSAVQDALICIQGDDGTYLRYTTDTAGKVSTASTFTVARTYDLTITKDGFLPYIGELRIYPEPSDLTILSNDDISFEFDTLPPVIDMNGFISVDVTNQNPSPTENSFWVNITDTFNYMGIPFTDYLGQMQVGTVAANSQVTVKMPWTPVYPGAHVFDITVDSHNEVAETNEDNNVFTISQEVSGPDLKIGSTDIKIDMGPGASVGDKLSINVTVHNMDWGQVDKVEVAFYDGNPDSAGILLGRFISSEPLNINEHVTLTLTTPAVTAGGIHKYFVEVDPDNEFFESNEVNNRAFISYDVNYPPSIIEPDDIKVSEDQPVSSVIDLLNGNYISDENNNTDQMDIKLVSVSEPSSGVMLREGRYIDVLPAANWSGISEVNLSISDGLVVIYTEFSVIVEAVNDPPELTAIELEKSEIEKGSELYLKIKLFDIDSELVKVSISSPTDLFAGKSQDLEVSFGTPLAPGAWNWDGQGNLSFRYETRFSEPGEHTLKVILDDSLAQDSGTISIELSDKSDKKEEADTLLGMGRSRALAVIAVIIMVIILVTLLIIFNARRQKPSDLEGGIPSDKESILESADGKPGRLKSSDDKSKSDLDTKKKSSREGDRDQEQEVEQGLDQEEDDDELNE